jgi:hypothetical protein
MIMGMILGIFSTWHRWLHRQAGNQEVHLLHRMLTRPDTAAVSTAMPPQLLAQTEPHRAGAPL